MLTTNTNFDTKHALEYRHPLYLISFDGETVKHSNRITGDWFLTDAGGDYITDASGERIGVDIRDYLVSISGNDQTVTPEEGTASIGGFTVEILDYDGEITALLATDTYNFHRKKTTIKAGYVGMAETDMLTIFTGWVTDLKKSKDLTSYIFSVTDPQKWMQRKVFRSASDSVPVIVQGNPLNILLAVLTSTGDGTNGDYDWYDEPNGLGIPVASINVSAIEAVRDNWFPGDSHWMQFTVTEKEVAKDWISREICKVLNCYPVIDGQGRFSLKPFRPPLTAIETIQTFDEDNIIGTPEWDANFGALINEIEVYYDHDGSDFDETDYIDSTSVNNRGSGKKALSIKSKGLHSSGVGSHRNRVSDIIVSRKNKVFGRFATPPVKISFKTFFSKWLSEAGDIASFTHRLVPDIVSGVSGYTAERMEIVSRSIDWKKGLVKIDLLNTGFKKDTYMVLSPVMTVTAGTSGTEFTVSVADAAKWSEGWEARIFDAKGRLKASDITILTIDTDTGEVTCDDIGATPAAGWKVQFAAYASQTAAQQLYWTVMAAGANLIVP